MQFDNATLSTLATKAVLDSMTQEHRDQLLQRAVAQLFEKEPSRGYGKTERTRFEAAFDDALGSALAVICRQLMETEQYQAQLKKLMAEAVEKAMTGENRERLADIFAGVITAGLESKRGY